MLIKEDKNSDEMVEVSLLMDFVPGVDLKTFIKGRNMTPDLIKRIFSCLVSALVVLNQNKIIHRDIKPTNIMVHADENFRT